MKRISTRLLVALFLLSFLLSPPLCAQEAPSPTRFELPDLTNDILQELRRSVYQNEPFVGPLLEEREPGDLESDLRLIWTGSQLESRLTMVSSEVVFTGELPLTLRFEYQPSQILVKSDRFAGGISAAGIRVPLPQNRVSVNFLPIDPTTGILLYLPVVKSPHWRIAIACPRTIKIAEISDGESEFTGDNEPEPNELLASNTTPVKIVSTPLAYARSGYKSGLSKATAKVAFLTTPNLAPPITSVDKIVGTDPVAELTYIPDKADTEYTKVPALKAGLQAIMSITTTGGDERERIATLFTHLIPITIPGQTLKIEKLQVVMPQGQCFALVTGKTQVEHLYRAQ